MNTLITKAKMLAGIAILVGAIPALSNAQITDNNSCQDPNYVQSLNKVYRQWNPSMIDHFYTNYEGETAPGYMYETATWGVLNTRLQNSITLYRFYGQGNTDHFYSTTSQTPVGYVSEGIVGFIFPNEVPGSTPLYRLYRHNSDGDGDHLYTTSIKERDSATTSGYVYETIEGYVCPMI